MGHKLNGMTNYALGIDIGGTNTKFGIVDRGGNVVHHGSISTTDFEDFHDYFDAMADASKERHIFLRADRAVPYGDLMDVLETLRAGGLGTCARTVAGAAVFGVGR